MPRHKNLTVWLLAGFLVSTATAQNPSETPPAVGESASMAHIDAQADQRVRVMSAFLAGQKKFRFNVEITYDAVEPDGQKLQLGRRSKVEVMRPNGLRAESQGDRGSNQVSTFDGEYFLLHDRANNVYARVKTPETLQKFFEFLFEEYGISPPLVDFLLRDVHGALTDNADSVSLLGDAFIAEHECEHIAFTGELLDWQLWIQKGEAPWPRKFVITYKDMDVRPQFMAVFRKWQSDAPITSDQFATTPPDGATEAPLERFVESDSDEDEAAASDDEMDAQESDSEDNEGD